VVQQWPRQCLRLIPRIHTSRSSSVVTITGIAFGWIGSTIAFGAVSESRVGFALELGPDSGEGEQGPAVIPCKPHDILFAGLVFPNHSQIKDRYFQYQ